MTEQRTRLENGLTIITESIPTVRSASVGVWITRGSRDEPEPLNGVTHFLEHMLFKGTESRGVRDIAVAIDAMGGQLDAFTSRESACYYAMVLDEHLADAVDLLTDLLLHPRFDPEELERERGVVLEEIASAEDDPEDLLFETYLARLWPDHSLGLPILGTPATVSAFVPDQLRQRMSMVGGADMIIAAAGNLEHERLVGLVAEGFGEVGTGGPWPERIAPSDRRHCFLLGRGDLEQVQLYLASGAPEAGSSDRYAAEVLNTLLGGSVSSRLFQVVREERGLAYSVYSSLGSYCDAGHLWIAAGTRASSAREVLALIAAELADLRARTVDEEELGRIKEHLKGALMLGLENTFGRMANLARQQMAFGRSYDLDAILAGIDGVTAEDLQRLANERFHPERLCCGVVGSREVAARLAREWGDSLVLPGGIDLATEVVASRG